MEKKKISLALVRMPSNRVKNFVENLPKNVLPHEALFLGIRCREEALAFDAPNEDLISYLESFPKYAAVGYYEIMENSEGSAKLCYFAMNFQNEPRFYEVWCQCSKIVAGLSVEDLKKLHFAIFVEEAEKRVCFLSYTLTPNDDWTQLMLNFAHNIQPDDKEWENSEIKFTSCDIKMNF